MSAISPILEQLELNETFYYQFLIFFFLFLVLKRFFFRPFLKLIELRNQSTIKDREAAENMAKAAHGQLESYKSKLAQERAKVQSFYQETVTNLKKEEAATLSAAREQAKQITQKAAESLGQQQKEIKKQLEVEVESMAFTLSEKLLSRKA